MSAEPLGPYRAPLAPAGAGATATIISKAPNGLARTLVTGRDTVLQLRGIAPAPARPLAVALGFIAFVVALATAALVAVRLIVAYPAQDAIILMACVLVPFLGFIVPVVVVSVRNTWKDPDEELAFTPRTVAWRRRGAAPWVIELEGVSSVSQSTERRCIVLHLRDGETRDVAIRPSARSYWKHYTFERALRDDVAWAAQEIERALANARA